MMLPFLLGKNVEVPNLWFKYIIFSFHVDDTETESSVLLANAERIRIYQEENKYLGALVILTWEL